jgi:diguanylate cyclase (GGDEF)-like protein
MVPLVAATGGYVVLPPGPLRDGAFALLGLACVVTAVVGLHRHPPRRRAGWLLVLTGFLGWVAGDALFSLQGAWGITAYPSPADAVYLVAYVLMAAGLVVMVRRRAANGDLAAVLDAAILAIGAAVVAGVFVVAPAASDSSLSALGKLTSTFYPAADILLLAILVRFWATPSARTTSFRLLICALGFIFAGDVYYTTTTIMTGSVESQLANDLVWFAGYILIAGSTWDRSVHDLAEPAPGLEDVSDPTKRLLLLTCGLLLPPMTLLGDGLDGEVTEWPIVLAGSVLLSVLVLVRMAGLLTVVRAQAVQLAALARSDGLTGVPNRRSWDYLLSRACRTSEDGGSPLTLAVLDLDHFKTYNDLHGHPAGDLLLKEATAAWVERLKGSEVLARVGGEEFALLLPGHDAEAARVRVLELLASTPRGMTFSAGLATWQPGTEPAVAVAAADRALYDAKRSGRNRVCLAPRVPAGLVIARPRIVLQPVVDLGTGEMVGVEALSRFPDQQPVEVFEQARTLGRLPELEATAISAARVVALPGLFLSVNVDIASLPTPRIREALAGDLDGIVLEVTEHTHTPVDPEALEDVQVALRDYRGRGALVAVDDWGTGYSDMDRLELLQPEIVKIDMSIVHDLDSARHQALLGSVLAWSNRRHARVCAEGIETEGQLERLRRLGVHLGQGFHLARPQAADQLGSGTRSSAGPRDAGTPEAIPT